MIEDKLQLQTQVSQYVFCLSAGPQGPLPMFHRVACDIEAVTSGTPEGQPAALNRVALSL